MDGWMTSRDRDVCISSHFCVFSIQMIIEWLSAYAINANIPGAGQRHALLLSMC